MSHPPSHGRWRAVRRAAVLALLAGARAAGAQDRAVTTVTANLRSGPSRGSTLRGTVPPGDTVTLLPHGHRTGYYRVSLRRDRTGWITEAALRFLERSQPTVPPGPFDGCPAEGTVSPRATRRHELEALNRLKNRSASPTDADLDSTVTLARLLGSGSDDTGRFDSGRAAEVTGYVLHVKPGGEHETGNCRYGDPIHRDTHIELTLSPTDTLEVRRVIVEVTPRWRAALHAAGVDWLTETLRQTVEHRWVRVRGWLLFDEEHQGEAENTHPGGRSNWRGTVWEIHPVTGLTVVPHP